ncbi:MAG: riboflavin synthase, partial [Alphaproteobacteria bacterium]
LRRCAKGLRKGDSLAVNGCCLTVVKIDRKKSGAVASFDLLEETWKRTAFSDLKKGDLVNLERSLTPDGRLGGHFVTGHVDGVGRIRKWEAKGGDYLLEISAPKGVMDYVVEKGSIAVDGISLTVADVGKNWFRIWIIPHTYQVTNLRRRAKGERVNLEADLIGKYVARFTGAYTTASSASPASCSSNPASGSR